nr:hypothetical protein [uncultured Shinella sp.]
MAIPFCLGTYFLWILYIIKDAYSNMCIFREKPWRRQRRMRANIHAIAESGNDRLNAANPSPMQNRISGLQDRHNG